MATSGFSNYYSMHTQTILVNRVEKLSPYHDILSVNFPIMEKTPEKWSNQMRKPNRVNSTVVLQNWSFSQINNSCYAFLEPFDQKKAIKAFPLGTPAL